MVLIIQYAPRQLTLSWQMEAVLSGVKINGSNTRLLYWCHGVDGRFVSPHLTRLQLGLAWMQAL